MTTPRIEEMVADLHNNIVDCVYGMNLNIGGKEAKRLYAELGNSMLLRKQLTQALTKAHQAGKKAGMDEAVEENPKKEETQVQHEHELRQLVRSIWRHGDEFVLDGEFGAEQKVLEIFRQYIDYYEKYQQLLYCVSNKYKGQTRHETALRYLLNAEKTETIKALQDNK